MAYRFKKLADNWGLLTDAQKTELFMGTNYLKADIEQLLGLGESFKIASYSDNLFTPSAYLTAIPRDKLFIPRDLFGATFETIDNIKPNINILGGDVSLTHFNTDFIDSVSGKVWKLHGNVGLNVSNKKFGEASLALLGSEYISSANDKQDFNFGDNDFSIEMWIYPTVNSSFQTLFAFSGDFHGVSLGIFNGTTSNIALYCSSDGTSWNVADGEVSEDNVISLNKWQHIALTRNNQNLYVFVDGKKVIDITIGRSSLYFDETDSFQIGAGADGTYLFNGLIDEVRIAKGMSHYKKVFVPAGVEFNSITSLPNIRFAVTKDLNNYFTFDKTRVVKTSTTGERETRVLRLDGASQYLIIPSNALSGKDKWTIEVVMSTTQAVVGDNTYDSPCIFGFDMQGENGEFIIQNRNGYLAWYCEATETPAYGYTDKFIADGNKHNISLVGDGIFYMLYCDKELVAKFQMYGHTFPEHEIYVGYGGHAYSSLDLYEVRVWDVVRTQSYLGETIKRTAVGLEAWYLMENASENEVIDAGLKGNTGTIVNNPELVTVQETITTTTETLGFVAIESFNVENVLNLGIDASTLAEISEVQWDMFFNGTEGDAGIGIAFAISQDNSNQVASIDDIVVYVDMKGEWRSAHKGEDFEYGYPNNNLLRVQLLTDGDYKINYQNMVGGM